MEASINRDYTFEERLGLAILTEAVAEAYLAIAPICQASKAGNNSQSMDEETGIIQLGNPQEPSILHCHVLARGNPEFCYIEDVKLDGPAPGLCFDMRGKTNEPGNESKVKWRPGEMQKVITRLRMEIEKIKSSYEDLNVQIILP